MEYKFTTDNFEKEVLQSELPVLVDFYADWCGPCKMMAPIVEGLAQGYDGKVKVGKLNIDDEMEIAQQYRVMSIPTFIFSRMGKRWKRASVRCLRMNWKVNCRKYYKSTRKHP